MTFNNHYRFNDKNHEKVYPFTGTHPPCRMG